MCWFHKYPSSPLSPCHLWLHGSRQRKGSRPWNTIIPHQPSTSKPFQDVPSYTQCQNSPRLVVRNISSIIIHHHPSSSILRSSKPHFLGLKVQSNSRLGAQLLLQRLICPQPVAQHREGRLLHWAWR